MQSDERLPSAAHTSAQGRSRSGLTGPIPWLLLVTGFVLFFTGDTLLGNSKFSGAVWNFGHILYFSLLTVLVNSISPIRTWRSVVVLSVSVLFAGVLIEICQAWIGRDASVGDIVNNLAGVWICVAWLHPSNSLRIRLARIAVMIPLVPAVSALLSSAALRVHELRSFPVLADFEFVLEPYEFNSEVRRSKAYKSHGEYGLELTLSDKRRYSGITIQRPFADWSPYRTLRLDFFNPDATPVGMVIRIDDAIHDESGWKDEDRFNYRFQVDPGWNNLVIPLEQIRQGPADRQMDMSRISSVIVYASQLTARRTLYLDYLRLE